MMMPDGGEGGRGVSLVVSQNQWQGMHKRDAQRVDLVRDSTNDNGSNTVDSTRGII